MCGIVGCVGHENAVNFVVDGLEALEYRGYDSMGVAIVGEETPDLKIYKSLGGVTALGAHIELSDHAAKTAIGHTRWATHGKPSVANAHPHINGDGTIAVVHNGVIENHAWLRSELQDNGYVFRSETDSEVIPHLLDMYLREGKEPEDAFETTMSRLTGAYAVLAVLGIQPDTMYAAKLGSPLVLGVNDHEHFASSDPSVWVSNTKQAIRMEDSEIAVLSPNGYRLKAPHGHVSRPPEILSDDFQQAELGNFPHWMLKEISEQPEVIRAVTSGRVFADSNLVRLGGLESPEIREKLKRTERLIVVACGTSYHAGLIGERLIEEIADIPVEVQLASEFQYRNEPISHDTAVLAISQSGETADTIAAITKANELGLLTLGVNNSPGSTIDNLTDAGVHCRAGKEVSVASTKAFISQVTALSEIALHFGRKSNADQQPLMQELAALPAKVEKILADTEAIEAAAKKYADYRNFLYIGRSYEYPSALEGALKLKEISYIHAEGQSAGEMKHGTLALIDEDFPTFAIATASRTHAKTISNIQEIKSRGGPILALANEGDSEIAALADDVIYVPQSLEPLQPILNAVVMQLFAYYVATARGYNVDRPRNLAKSVTVE